MPFAVKIGYPSLQTEPLLRAIARKRRATMHKSQPWMLYLPRTDTTYRNDRPPPPHHEQDGRNESPRSTASGQGLNVHVGRRWRTGRWQRSRATAGVHHGNAGTFTWNSTILHFRSVYCCVPRNLGTGKTQGKSGDTIICAGIWREPNCFGNSLGSYSGYITHGWDAEAPVMGTTFLNVYATEGVRMPSPVCIEKHFDDSRGSLSRRYPTHIRSVSTFPFWEGEVRNI